MIKCKHNIVVYNLTIVNPCYINSLKRSKIKVLFFRKITKKDENILKRLTKTNDLQDLNFYKYSYF